MNRFFSLFLCLCAFQAIGQQPDQPGDKQPVKPLSAQQKQHMNTTQLMTKSAKEFKISADEAYKGGDYNLALALYLDELAKKPEDVDLRFKIGQCYLETDIKKSNAIEYFEYALDHGFKNNEIAFVLGRAYLYA